MVDYCGWGETTSLFENYISPESTRPGKLEDIESSPSL